jgi:hypothetical protein
MTTTLTETAQAIDACLDRILADKSGYDYTWEETRALKEFTFYDVLSRYVALRTRTRSHRTSAGLLGRLRVMNVLNALVNGSVPQLVALRALARVIDEHPGEAVQLSSSLFDNISSWSPTTFTSPVPGLFTKEIYDLIFARAVTPSRENYLYTQLELDVVLDDDVHELCITLAKNWTGTWASMIETATELTRVGAPA